MERKCADQTELIDKLKTRAINAEAHGRRLNLIFIGISHDDGEDVVAKVREFMVNQLEMNKEWVDSLRFRDVHRLGVNKGVHPIIVAFINQVERNMVFKNAYKLKSTNYVINVDLPYELAIEQGELLNIRKTIREENPSALASISYRSYKPVLLVKHDGSVQSYTSDMLIKDLQPGDRRRRT